MNITKEVAEFVATLQADDLPQQLAERTRFLILDCVGNAVRARYESESTAPLLAAIRAMGLASGNAHVFADPSGYSPAGAVLANATLAHSLDFDDTHAQAIVHPGAAVIPAALGAAELNGGSGKELLAAIVAGYEVALRLALALPAGAHYARGFHPSATCGAFGAAAAAARMLRLGTDATASAFGIALSQSAGSLQFLANGAWTKRFQVGWASMAGFSAALLAREGFRGAAEPIEGKHGFLLSYAPAPEPSRVTEDIGTVWETMHTGVKPYPSCRWGHAGIDAAIALRSEHGFTGSDIESATLGISRAGMLLIGAPAEKKANPRNIVDAQFSAPFAIAAALATGKMEWDSYQLIDDPAIRNLMPRIVCEIDPEIEAEFPENMSGKLTVRAGGRIFLRTVIVPRGEPANFLTEAELRAKFFGLVNVVLGAEAARGLADTVLNIDRLENPASILQDYTRSTL
jgi:2-methylcitrate dehydratase PrpD